MKYHILNAVLFLSAVSTVHCYSTGAPAAACTKIYPEGHSGPSQDLSTNPFQLSLSDFDETHGGEFYYVPGQQYSLTLSGSGGEEFRGFLVQARTVADGSPVGVFTDNGDDQKLSSCTPSESAITHLDNNLKTSVTFSWRAEGTNDIAFLFAVVVHNSENISTFYSTAESAVLHPCGLPLYESSGRCVETCPNGQIGNYSNTSATGLTGTCQQLSDDFRLALNATVYYAVIDSDTAVNTPVYRLRASINVNENPIDVSFTLAQTGQIDNLFDVEGIFLNQFDTTIGNEKVFDTTINLVNDPTLEFDEEDYPVELDIDIQFIVLFASNVPLSSSSKGRGSIQRAPDACDTEPCQNGATCNSTDRTLYTCSCLPGYTGMDCEEVTDPCIAYQPCDNQATCETISLSEYFCNCAAGYTGTNCTDVDDPCLVYEPCVNGDCSSIDSSEYTCDCFTGYTGQNCSINIDDCLVNDCVNGTCNDGIASYDCECDAGFTGSLCDEDINECEAIDCNNGTCVDLVNDYMCNCYQDYTGQHCNQIINNCDSSPCNQRGTLSCEDGNSTYTCICAAGFTGQNCTEEVFGCTSDPCENGATCINEPSGAFACMCPPEWTGDTCSEDAFPCDPNPCANGGSCTETSQGGSFECQCSSGFNGTNCENDLNFCAMMLGRCVNGTCVEGYGNETSCNCAPGFTGNTCAEDNPNELFCEDVSCSNGATCNEGYGPETNCTCARGFMGDSCEEDDPSELFCGGEMCANGGSCNESFGDAITCTCLPGYSGPDCRTVIGCASNPCQNGGTCQNGQFGSFTCVCPPEWTGSTCDTDVLLADSTEHLQIAAIIGGLVAGIALLLCGLALIWIVLALRRERGEYSFTKAGQTPQNLSVASLDAVITNYTSADDPCEMRQVPAEDEEENGYSGEERVVFLCWTTLPSVKSEDAASIPPQGATSILPADSTSEGATNTPMGTSVAATGMPQDASEGTNHTPPTTSESVTNTPATNAPPTTDEGGTNTPPATNQGGTNTPATNQGAISTPPATNQGAISTPPATNEGGTNTPSAASEGANITPPPTSEETLYLSFPAVSNENDVESNDNTSQE